MSKPREKQTASTHQNTRKAKAPARQKRKRETLLQYTNRFPLRRQSRIRENSLRLRQQRR
jgi:hypothetical protein